MPSFVKYAAGLGMLLALPLLAMAQDTTPVFPLVVTPTATPAGFTSDPTSLLPTNGLWVSEAFSMDRSGQCLSEAFNGDNDGPGADYDPFEQEGNPVCGFGDGPFLIVENGRQEYVPDSDSLYAALDRIEGQLITDSQGVSTGSIMTTMRKTYQVIAPDLILVTITMSEDGGCTLSGQYQLMLKTPDESVCGFQNFNEDVFMPISTPEPVATVDPTDDEATLYLVTEPYPSDTTTCNADNTPPKFEDANVRLISPLEMELDYGEEPITLYLSGSDYYQYTTGYGPNSEEISMFRVDDGWSLGWVKRDGDSEYCRWDATLVRPGDLTDDIIETAEPSDETTTETDFVALTEGTYEMGWMDAYMGDLCPKELKAKVPDFETVDITLADSGDATMTYEGGEVVVPYMADQKMYMMMDAPLDEGSLFVSLVAYEDGTAYLSYQAMFDDGTSCTRSAELKAQ